MSASSRRTFIKGAAAVGAGAAAAQFIPSVGSASAAPHAAGKPSRVRTTREEHRVVVIGSGFGGGISALRLAQAGVDVLVLERGRRWTAGPNSDTFPRASAPDKRILWHRSAPTLFGRPVAFEPYVGLLETVMGDNMMAICPTGVGGGSLIYQGMTLQPAESVFNEWFPEQLDWQLLNRVHYPRVARMLKIAVAPDRLINSANYKVAREFAKRVRRAGLPLAKIPMPIDWNYALAELDGKMRPSYTNGDGALGVNNGGKHSVDVTYIARAEATGRVRVATQHTVTSIARRADGKWTVHVDRTDETGRTVEKKILTTPALIMAAGSVNTSKLLVKAKATGAISDLPDGVGRGWGTNADRIYSWVSPASGFGPVQGGPVVYGSKNWSDPKNAFTFIQASMPPVAPEAVGATTLVGFGVSKGRGKVVFDSATGEAVLRWPHEGDASIQHRYIEPAIRKITRSDLLLDSAAVVPNTWHPLGGANLGVVCDLEGRVKGQKGLYVLDGALMPGNTAACNPSMTIAAIAERALDDIVAKDVGSLI
ncbi:GMC oxidoreductase [Gordonia pseudamarae]